VLTPDEKRADMFWIYSIFDQNYAPRDYKASTLGFDYATLKSQYIDRAVATTDNDSFYYVMEDFVAEFKDAHTASSLIPSSLPGRTPVAYLGFDGVRTGDTLTVTSLLPTVQAGSAFPIKVGDEILKMDGQALRDIVLTQSVKERNLGNDETNLTYHMNLLFGRTSIAQRMPTKSSVDLTVRRQGVEQVVTLPWVVEDLQAFTAEQKAAADAAAAAAKANAQPQSKIAGLDAKILFDTGSEWLQKGMMAIKSAGTAIGNPLNHCMVYDNMLTWSSRSVIDAVVAYRAAVDGKKVLAADDLKQKLAVYRNIPADAAFVTEAQTYPTYFASLPNGGVYAYMFIDSFEPDSDEATVLAEFSTVLDRMKLFGVKSLVLDTIDNTGGLQTLGMQMARLLSKTPIKFGKIQLKISETWINQYEDQSLNAPSPAEKALAKQVVDQLKADRDAGKAISDPIDVDRLMPFQFTTGNDKLPDGIKTVLLVNEMCASMCDIFAATLQDNKIATVVGSRTMGAGGNVVQHGQAPNSNLILNQTESLILRADGTPIENHGVTPDVAVNVNAGILQQYEPTRQAALAFLSGCTGDACSKADAPGADSQPKAGGCSMATSAHDGAAPLAGLLALLGFALLARGRRRRG
jgi:MYXO-CTERM domain-containing protein